MKVLVFQHIASEHPGSFRDVMAARGVAWEAVALDEGEVIPPLEEYDALLVMGGPMDVWEEAEHPWLVAEKAAIAAWVAAKRPYLGVCLGHQLLAAACGGEVALMEGMPEVGMARVSLGPDPLFAGLDGECTCLQWHGAEVVRLAAGARVIASGPACAVQAQALGSHAWGLQFHMELTATTALEWGTIPAYIAALERARGVGALAEIQRDVARHYASLHSAATRIFNNFLDLAQAANAARAAR